MIARALALCLLVIAGSVSAHRQHVALTEVVTRDDRLQITHRFHEHDAAEWLRQRYPTRIDITSLKDQARFALYVESAFDVRLGDAPLPLELLGAELDGAWLFVYQEAQSQSSADELMKGLRFDSDVLMDMLPDQLHQVTVDLKGMTGTATISADSPPQQITPGDR